MSTTANISAVEQLRQVMAVDPSAPDDDQGASPADIVRASVWARPGLSRRDRRWVTLVCLGFDNDQEEMDAHVRAALRSGDISIDELLEFVLHFAVYCGWPKASQMEGTVRTQWAILQQERGEEQTSFPRLGSDTLGPADRDARIAGGEACFEEVNLIDAPAAQTPFIHGGILNFVFGHVWQRPGLDRRARRFVTVASVIVCDSPVPISSHIGSALESGDISKTEMDEIAVHVAAYSSFARGERLQTTADAEWARIGR